MADKPPTQSCGNCRYGILHATSLLTETLCQRNPPRVDPSTWLAKWPSVSIQWWCGEWAPSRSVSEYSAGSLKISRLALSIPHRFRWALAFSASAQTSARTAAFKLLPGGRCAAKF